MVGQREKKIQNGQMVDKRFEDEGSGGSEGLADGGPDCTVEVHRPEESEEELTMLRQGGISKSKSCQEF